MLDGGKKSLVTKSQILVNYTMIKKYDQNTKFELCAEANIIRIFGRKSEWRGRGFFSIGLFFPQ